MFQWLEELKPKGLFWIKAISEYSRWLSLEGEPMCTCIIVEDGLISERLDMEESNIEIDSSIGLCTCFLTKFLSQALSSK